MEPGTFWGRAVGLKLREMLRKCLAEGSGVSGTVGTALRGWSGSGGGNGDGKRGWETHPGRSS